MIIFIISGLGYLTLALTALAAIGSKILNYRWDERATQGTIILTVIGLFLSSEHWSSLFLG